MSTDRPAYVGPNGNELPGEHWNARLMREASKHAAATEIPDDVWFMDLNLALALQEPKLDAAYTRAIERAYRRGEAVGVQAGREAAAKAIEADRSYNNLSGAPYTYFARVARGAVCRCGHLARAHDAGECWTHPDNHKHPTPPCPCSWYEETS